MDRIESVAIFVEVAERRSFATAARRLARSPAAVTRAVGELETRLGVRLLNRTTRAVSLTEAGDRFLAGARRVLADFEEIERAAAGEGAAPRGELRITAPILFGRLHVLPIVTEFLSRFADVSVSLRPLSAPARLRVSIDHWEGGGLQELDEGQVRPFLTGMLGLTRYAAQGDNEIRFTISAGGGVKLFPSSRVGARLDGRLFATFIDAGGSAVACASGRCFVALHIDVVWQVEFTTGIVVRFP